MTLDAAIADYLATHEDADISDLAQHIRALARTKRLDQEGRDWLAAIERRGIEAALDQRLRGARVTLHGVSTRRYVSLLQGDEAHRWATIESVIGDAARTEQAAAHSWSVIGEAVGMIRSQRRTLLVLGEPVIQVDKRIREMLDAALDGDGDSDEDTTEARATDTP